MDTRDLSADFALDPGVIYFNHAAVGPWPRRTLAAVQAFAEENARQGSKNYATWLGVEQRLRERLARLIRAPSPEDVALTKNTSEALSMIAHGLDWRPGDNLVSIAQEFPSNRLVWESLAPLGVEVRFVDLARSPSPEADLIALCDGRTRLLSVSSVQYARGLRLDLEALGEACAARGVLFCVDAIQSLGVVPFDVEACRADFVVGDGHKWLFGPEGVALFYSRPAARDRLTLREYGWHMVEAVGDFDRTDWSPARSARRFECGSPNLLGIHALEASLSLIEDWGVPAIFQRVADNVSLLIELVDREGLRLLSPRSPERRAGILTFEVPGFTQEAMHQGLRERGVICAVRGGGIRFSPHAHNDSEQCRAAMEVLGEVRAALG